MIIVPRGQKSCLWRAIDSEREMPDFLVQRHRNTRAAARLIRKLLKKTGITPSIMVTDKLCSYGAANKMLGLSAVHEPGMRKNNRCATSHLSVHRREQKMQRFKSPGSAQRFLNLHANVYEHFTTDRHPVTRPTTKELREQAFRQ